MEKDMFFKLFNHNSDKIIISKLYEQYILTLEGDFPNYLEVFLPGNYYLPLIDNSKRIGVEIRLFSNFTHNEKKIVIFTPLNYPYEINPDIKLLKIINCSKFKNLIHKDYLGSIMNLGIKREKIGDLIVNDNFCILESTKDIINTIIENLKKVGNNPISFDEDIDSTQIPIPKFENIIALSNTPRLDKIVSCLINQSREKAIKLIDSGKIFVNGLIITEKNHLLLLSSTITIRGYGKFIYVENLGCNKKGKEKYLFNKYS